MLIKEREDKFIFADKTKVLRYQKNVEGELKNVVVFNPQPEHFIEAGYKELIKTEMPETQPNQYIETTYELKDDKYYEVHTVVDMPEVMLDE